MTLPVRWACIGSSGFAASTVAPTLVRSSSSELVGVVGSTHERASALVRTLGSGRAYRDLEEAVSDETVDAMWIATTDPMHAPMAIAALEAGKHVLLEKPMAISVAEGLQITEAARRCERVLHVGTRQRFRQPYRVIKHIVERGELGELGFVRIHFQFPASRTFASGTWRGTAAGSGPAWVTKEIGAHVIDMALWWTNGVPLIPVGAVLGRLVHPIELEDTSSVLLQMPSGGSVLISISAALKGYVHSAELYGTEGWIRAFDPWRGGGIIEQGLPDDAPWRAASRRIFKAEPTEYFVPYLAQVEDMAAAIAGEPSIAADGEAGLSVLRVIESALQLASRGAVHQAAPVPSG